MSISVCVYIYIYMYTCMYVYIYIYMYIYIYIVLGKLCAETTPRAGLSSFGFAARWQEQMSNCPCGKRISVCRR